ncbi:MAG: class I SAM-dependent methyltransferase [Candidatus Heimdallarchaeota archaeon]|nr:class I SAM-dependent methyltransferase [Candidatus Heimdallarchaeota archaeon]MCK5143136.1 class I SAM-dependent methyltransferase [Candidatus Heimdallarchaeota archaeon]
MKILESAPYRYDKGIKILTLGNITKAYDRLTQQVKKGDNILDVGCGTGMLTLHALIKGANVTGIDINTEMLEIARIRIENSDFKENVNLLEMGVAELDNFDENEFDVIMSGLCFSELSNDELNYTLKFSKKILKQNSLLIIADEVKSNLFVFRFLNFLIRIPLVIVTYILTQTTTKAVKGLEEKVTRAGFKIESIRKNKMRNFIELVARNIKEN